MFFYDFFYGVILKIGSLDEFKQKIQNEIRYILAKMLQLAIRNLNSRLKKILSTGLNYQKI